MTSGPKDDPPKTLHRSSKKEAEAGVRQSHSAVPHRPALPVRWFTVNAPLALSNMKVRGGNAKRMKHVVSNALHPSETTVDGHGSIPAAIGDWGQWRSPRIGLSCGRHELLYLSDQGGEDLVLIGQRRVNLCGFGDHHSFLLLDRFLANRACAVVSSTGSMFL